MQVKEEVALDKFVDNALFSYRYKLLWYMLVTGFFVSLISSFIRYTQGEIIATQIDMTLAASFAVGLYFLRKNQNYIHIIGTVQLIFTFVLFTAVTVFLEDDHVKLLWFALSTNQKKRIFKSLIAILSLWKVLHVSFLVLTGVIFPFSSLRASVARRMSDIYHLLAGMVMAMQYGFEMKDSLELAEKLRIEQNLFSDKSLISSLEQLPASCSESADELEKEIEFFNTDNVFPEGTLRRFISFLRAYNDKDLSERLYKKDDEILKLVNKFINYG